MDVESSSSTAGDSPQRVVRGRPRGTGRGRYSGTRARGSATAPRGRRGRGGRTAEGRDAVLQLTRERSDVAKRHVQTLNLEQCQDILVQIATQSASVILDIMEQSNPSPEQPQPMPGVPAWCTCSRCRDMPTEEEKVCCGRSPEHCTTLLPDFHVLCLDEAVLALARLYREDVLALPADDNFNRANRHSAYRQYVLWTYGKLGAGQRKVIPSCVVWKIRTKYPEPTGQYVGFLPGRLA
uniref:P2X purinoceptor 7-like isoform X1 n=1 Tax=Crassostrea virginica TaxID=6565 RepID=A0A8B8B3G3_CRAVI|nr:P2X purinoceptor 7-like isoform X1 [Crassostrea virginica]